jgi:hypothetical protein
MRSRSRDLYGRGFFVIKRRLRSGSERVCEEPKQACKEPLTQPPQVKRGIVGRTSVAHKNPLNTGQSCVILTRKGPLKDPVVL